MDLSIVVNSPPPADSSIVMSVSLTGFFKGEVLRATRYNCLFQAVEEQVPSLSLSAR